MKNFLLFTLFWLISFSMFAQNGKMWKEVSKDEVIRTNKNVERLSFPQEFKLFTIDVLSIKQALVASPDRFSKSKSNTIISLPNINGVMEKFEVYEASNFEADLQAQYPEIRSYVGVGIDDKFAQIRFSVDPKGIQTMIFRAGKQNEFMEPYSEDGSVYAVYHSSRTKGKLPFTCSTEDHAIVENINPELLKANNNVLKTFRLAMSCNGEYTIYHGGTVAGALAAINATITRVNGVFEKDLAVRMNIIANTTSVIYTDPATYPYTGINSWNSQLQSTLTSVIGEANYDIGHMFGSTGGGGSAGCIGCVCVNGQKGSAKTSPSDGVPMGDTFDIDYVAHEMGHQFGANHTFSHALEGSGVNVEPGSGSSIMGYAGITNYNVQSHSDDYFTYRSILQIQNNLLFKTCPVNTAITHGAPIINAGSDWTIPKSTPFILTGTGTDPNNDPLTYSWEQNNTASAAFTGVSPTNTTSPNWRSRVPETVPVRYMPKLSSVLANTLTADYESVSSVARTLNFTLTGRDNVIGGGQTGSDEMIVNVSGSAGPFDVTSQNTDQLVWAQGSSQTITWTVNNTTSLVGSTNVDILLSTDGGQTFNITLASNTPNDGSEVITTPSINFPNCRVMVKPTGNIYYDINTKSFAVGNYVYQTQNVCTDYTFQLNQAVNYDATNVYTVGPLQINDSFTLTDANVRIQATHPNIGDLVIAILAPFQTTLNTALVLNNCNGSANMDLIFDSQGSALNCANTTNMAATIPYSSTAFASYVGNNSAGAWRIYIADNVNDNNNTSAVLSSVTFNLCRSALVPVLETEAFGLTDFSLYPNPNNGNFTVQFSSETSNDVNITVHDLRGRQVYSKAFQNNGLFSQELQLNNTASGIYLVTVQDGNRKEVKKIVVE